VISEVPRCAPCVSLGGSLLFVQRKTNEQTIIIVIIIINTTLSFSLTIKQRIRVLCKKSDVVFQL